MKFTKHFLYLIAIVALMNGCSKATNTPTKPAAAPVPVLATKAIAKRFPVEISAIGNVTPINKVTIRPQITGKLTAVNFKEGQPVKIGDLLFTLDARTAQAALARDKALLQNAQIQFERAQKLFEQKVISPDEFDTAKAARDTLAATVQADELNLSYCEIRSPVDGVAGIQQVFAGNIVKSPDDVMLTINQVQPIYVTFAIAERFLPDIKSAQAQHARGINVSFSGQTNVAARGELTFVDNAVDTTTGTIQLKGTFTNADSTLWPGQFVQVSLLLTELTEAIVVPNQAIQTGQNGQFVYLVKADETAEYRAVKTGASTSGETVITEGLAAGETVVTDGQLRLTRGAKVSVKTSLATETPSKP